MLITSTITCVQPKDNSRFEKKGSAVMRNARLFPCALFSLLCGLIAASPASLLAQIVPPETGEPGHVTFLMIEGVEEAMATLRSDAQSIAQQDPSLGPVVDSIFLPLLTSGGNAVNRLKFTLIEQPAETLTLLDNFFTFEAPLSQITSGYQSLDRQAASPMFSFRATRCAVSFSRTRVFLRNIDQP